MLTLLAPHITLAYRSIGEREEQVAVAYRASEEGEGDVGGQQRQQAGAQAFQFRAVQGPLARVGVQLQLVPVPVLEQVVARFQRPPVAEQRCV